MSNIYEWVTDQWEAILPHNIGHDFPWLSIGLILIGGLSVARLTLKTLYVFVQTFLLSGTSVSANTNRLHGIY